MPAHIFAAWRAAHPLPLPWSRHRSGACHLAISETCLFNTTAIKPLVFKPLWRQIITSRAPACADAAIIHLPHGAIFATVSSRAGGSV